MNSGTTTAPNEVTEASQVSAVLSRIACPHCHGDLAAQSNCLRCSCGASYSISGGVFDLRPPTRGEKAEEVDWSKHWSHENQDRIAQRFFSFYRKSVFARTAGYFVGRYFVESGVFVEAGCGTAETSMRIDKKGGARTLVALDLIRPVLDHCHPIMDVRICGDIFRLPFSTNSVDGVWNVGVMEHFRHDQIDEILREFRRVLRPGARVVLLWPTKYSTPQKMLRSAEFFINLRRHGERFRFHPDEISLVRSLEHGRQILSRNGYRPVCLDLGFRSLTAFAVLVGEKPENEQSHPRCVGDFAAAPGTSQQTPRTERFHSRKTPLKR